MKVYAMTDVGRVRPINEDSCYTPEAGERFCAVADGMAVRLVFDKAEPGYTDGEITYQA